MGFFHAEREVFYDLCSFMYFVYFAISFVMAGTLDIENGRLQGWEIWTEWVL